jgi:hypothetical protein
MRHNDNPEHEKQPDEQAGTAEKLALLHLNDGGIVLYDPADHLAWIRSDSPVQIAQML